MTYKTNAPKYFVLTDKKIFTRGGLFARRAYLL